MLKAAANTSSNSYSSGRHSEAAGRKVTLEHTEEGLAAYGSRRRCVGNTLLRYEADCALAKMSATEVRFDSHTHTATRSLSISALVLRKLVG